MAQDAVRQAQSLAQRQGQQQIEVEHLAAALLGQKDGIAARAVEKAGASPAALTQRIQQAIERMPRVSGSGAPAGQVYISPRVNEVLNAAAAEAQRMKDEFVSVEHLLLALVEVARDGPVAEARPHGDGRAGQARSRHRPRRADPPGDPDPLAPDEEQPRADR